MARIKRCPTSCNEACTKAAPPREIQFRKNGAPMGTNKNKFSNYCCRLVRDRVSCAITSWALVDKDLKEALWSDTKLYWNITSDKYKKGVTKYMGERWKAWKTRLRNKFITNADPENPRNPWDFGHIKIEPHEWEVFKAYVNSEDFKSLSARGKTNAEKNLHPHRLGSGGYETAKLKWKPTDVISMESSSTTTIINSSADDRGFCWLMARAVPTEVEGVYMIPNPATQDVGQRVQFLSQQVSQGEFHPVRHNDVLSASIGTAEHGGRVRGKDGWTGIKNAFGTGPRRPIHSDCYTKAETRQMIKEAVDEALHRQEEAFHQQIADMIQQANVIPPTNYSPPQVQSRPPTQVSSNFEVPMPIVASKEPVPCNIFANLAGRGMVMVAHGRIDRSLADTVHHSPLKPDQVRVCVDRVLEGFEKLDLPFPNDEQEVLGHALGGFAKWPACLVELQEQVFTQEMEVEPEKGVEPEIKSVESEKGKERVPSAASAVCQHPLLDDETLKRLDKSAKFLYNILVTLDGSIAITNWKIFGYNKEEYCTWLLKEDVIDVFKGNWVSLTVLQVFCLACEDKLNQYCNTRFRFLDPFICAASHMEKQQGLDKTTNYLRLFFDRVEDKSSFILLPYLESDHWILLIVQLSTLNCYIVNSLDHDYARQPLDIQCALTAALNLYLLDKPKNKKRTPKFNINLLQCPKQSGSTECGYYVMRAMYDITTKFAAQATLLAKLHPSAPQPYPVAEIEEVKGVLVDYIRRTLC